MDRITEISNKINEKEDRMGVLTSLRAYLKKKIINVLDLPQDEFVLIEDEKGSHSELKVESYLFKFIPLFKVVKVREFSWSGFISKSFKNIRDRIILSLRDFGKIFSERVVGSLKSTIENRVQKSKAKAFSAMRQEYDVLHEKFIAQIIKQSTHEFRKELLGKLKTSGGEVFARHVSQHLASIIMKVRDETNRMKNSDTVSIMTGENALPSGTRFFVQKKKVSVYVVEQFPQIRTITYNANKKIGYGKKYRLAFPFVIFVITLVDNRFLMLNLFFSKQSLRSHADTLYQPALSNIGTDCKVCFPAPNVSNGNPTKVVEEVIHNFWGSEFNHDWASYFDAAQSTYPQLHNLDKWESESHKNPLFACDLSWRSAGVSVMGVINNVVQLAEGKANENQPVNCVSALESYVAKMSEKIAQDIQESCFFLVPHMSINDKSLDIATNSLKQSLSSNCNDLLRFLNDDIDKTFSSDLIEEKCTALIKDTEAQISGIVGDAQRRMKDNIL